MNPVSRHSSLTGTSDASKYWGINQSITYGSTPILSSTAGIVDTGTTLLYIATDAFKRYVQATGAKADEQTETGLYTITAAQYGALKTLEFKIVGTMSFTGQFLC